MKVVQGFSACTSCATAHLVDSSRNKVDLIFEQGYESVCDCNNDKEP